MTSNIGLEQQSKPKYWQTSLQNSLTLVRKKNPPMEIWMVQIDGSTMKKVEGVGVVLIPLKGETLKYAVRL